MRPYLKIINVSEMSCVEQLRAAAKAIPMITFPLDTLHVLCIQYTSHVHGVKDTRVKF